MRPGVRFKRLPRNSLGVFRQEAEPHTYAPYYVDRHHKSSRAVDNPLRCFLDLPSGEMLDLC